MNNKKTKLFLYPNKAALLGMGILLTSFNNLASEFSLGANDEVSGTFNISVGYATSFRAEDKEPDSNALGLNELSELRVPNRWDRVSQIFSSDFSLDLSWQNLGIIVSGTYQYDTEIMNGDSISPLSTTLLSGEPNSTGINGNWSKATEDYAGNYFELLDAYIYGEFYLEDTPLEVRLGKQVINWGEGLYLLDGVSAQVPLNYNKLVTPGSELKEGYIGNNAIHLMLGIGEFSSFSVYYQMEWNRAELPPQGTLYGYDVLYRGGTEAIEGLGIGYRDPDQEAKSQGQWGASFRTLIEDTEFGIYYSRYHEPLPFLESTEDILSVFEMVSLLGVDASIQNELIDEGGNPLVCNFTSVLCTKQIWPENIDMLGMSFSTNVGAVALAGEVAYRPNRPLMKQTSPGVLGGIGAFGSINGENSITERNTVNASLNAIWLSRGGVLGLDSQTLIGQLGVDYIDGNTINVAPNYSKTRNKHDHSLPYINTADNTSLGVIAEWNGEWQSVYPNVNISLSVFIQHDFHGTSHFYGNFAEGRTIGSINLKGQVGNAWEASLGYSMINHDESDYEDLDTINFDMNYKF